MRGENSFTASRNMGGSLRQRLVSSFRHMMEVVKHCHDNGVIHRDLKPENMLLVSTSRESSIRLADLGLATYVKPGWAFYVSVFNF